MTRFAPAEHPILPIRDNAISVIALHLFFFCVEQQRFQKRIAETYVRQIGAIQIYVALAP